MFKTQTTRRLVIAAALTCCCAHGCHRSFYRRQADVEAQRLVLEKATDPRWNYSDGSIEIDPQSRMFDPFSSDHPPIPPDDPTSQSLMRCVDGKNGYPLWHANGDTDYVDNPEWRSYLPMNEKGQVVIDIDGAVQLAFLHSPLYQRQRETLYLSALDVSLERFGFDSQLFAGFNSFMRTQGRFRNGSSSSTLSQGLGSNNQGITLEKLGITGTTFVVGLANSIMWNFAGPNTQSATSLIDFSLIQPLLRGAGRDRIMESLTQSERTLLANVRQMERFRRGFYLEVVIGRRGSAALNRVGNFLGLPGAATANAGGYLGLLQAQQRIRIQEFNIVQLEGELNKFREFFLRERVDSLQLRQFENTVLLAQQRLFELYNAYDNSLDNFKAILGIPPDIEVVISDPALDQFKLISDDVTIRQNDLNALKDSMGQALIDIGGLIPGDDGSDNVDWPDELGAQILSLETALDNALGLIDQVLDQDLDEVKQDFELLSQVRPRRLEYLNKMQNQVESGQINIDVELAILDPITVKSTDELIPRLEDAVKKLGQHRTSINELKSRVINFEATRKETGDNKTLEDYIRSQILESIPEELTAFRNTLLEVSLLQAIARGNSVEIAEVDLQSDVAFEIARCFRRDWMNARATLVDQWRQIEFVADQLESQFDLVLEGDLGNVGDNPFKLRYETGQLRGGFRIDAPIVRQAERNAYRQTLIQYQQTKRSYYQFEDEINRNLRQTLRNLDLNKVLYELNRKSIQISIEQVELARFRLEEPARPGATRSSLGATTARDLTTAINGLQLSQNQFLDTWVAYEVLRRGLDFDLGTMQIDALGNWIDPGTIDRGIAERAAAAMGISLDCEFCYGIEPYQDDFSDGPGAFFDAPGGEDVSDDYYLEPNSQSPDLQRPLPPVPIPAPPGEVNPLQNGPEIVPPDPTPQKPGQPPADANSNSRFQIPILRAFTRNTN